MPEAHAEHGPDSPNARIASFERPASPGRPGPGEMRTASGSSARELVQGQRVVAVHDRLRAELTQVLHEVVDEAVVVVDDQDTRPITRFGHTRHGAIVAYSLRHAREQEQAVALHAAAAEEGPAFEALGAGRAHDLLAVGLAVVVANYLNLLPGADTENRYLLLGIALISGGFLMATNYR